MKKILLTTIFVLAASIAIYGIAPSISDAKVSGSCVNCHTMHNSQNGASMAKDATGAFTATPQGHLTLSSCIGCHNGLGGVSAPNIFGTTTRTAGGTFSPTVYAANKVHNVTDVTWTPNEVALLNITPGSNAATLGAVAGASQLTCAGSKGCHGDHTQVGSDAGIRGFHHGVNSVGGFRYLQTYYSGVATAVQGKGSSTWESGGATGGNHNVYYAMSAYNATTNDSMSALCANCHGNFHGGTSGGTATNVMTGTTWVRHPTENLTVASGWTAGSMNISYDLNPLGFTGADFTAQTTSTDYAASPGTSFGNGRVMCLSCHRAHGSDYADILRFDYTAQLAGSTTVTSGCLGCHHKQRG